MIKIRFGEYTLCDGIEMQITEYYGHGLSQEIDEHHRIISYSKEQGQKLGFQLDVNSNMYKKDIVINELKNSFFVVTKAIYKGIEFIVEPGFVNEIIVLRSDEEHKLKEIGYKEYLIGDEKKISEVELNFTRYFKVHNGYIISIKINLINNLWEERKQSKYNLPLPDGLEHYKEIKISSNG